MSSTQIMNSMQIKSSMQTWFFWQDPRDNTQQRFVFCADENFIKVQNEIDYPLLTFATIKKAKDLEIYVFKDCANKVAVFVDKRMVKKIKGFLKDFYNFFENPTKHCKLLFVPEWKKVFIEKVNSFNEKDTCLINLVLKKFEKYKYKDNDEFKDYREILTLKQIENLCS